MHGRNDPRTPQGTPLPLLLKNASNLAACLDILESFLQENGAIEGYFINLHRPEEQTMLCARVRLPEALSGMEKTYENYVFPAEGDNINVIACLNDVTVSMTRHNLKRFSPISRLIFERWQLHHLVAIPLQSEASELPPSGSLALLSQSAKFPRGLLHKIRRLVNEAAPFIRLHQRLADWEARALSIRDTESELQTLLRFVAEMSNLTIDSEIHPRIQEEFLRRFDLDLAAILILDQQILRCVDTLYRPEDAPWGYDWERHCARLGYALEFNDGATSNVFMNNHPLSFGNIPAIRALEMSGKDRANLDLLPHLQSFAILPIRKNGKPIGVLWLGSMRRQNALSSDHLVLAQHLCDFLGAVIENAHTYTLVEEQRKKIETLVSALQNRVEVLDQLANRDRLTGLFNFGSFEGELKKRIQLFESQTPPQPFSLIMCDVDHFKRFNDTYGHVAGNGVLQEVASRIGKTVRDSDYVARYGGEEFAVLLAHCNLKAAARLAERIRDNIARDAISIDGIDHHVTISLGCAEIIHGNDAASFIARADTALYAAKHGGRNRVELSE